MPLNARAPERLWTLIGAVWIATLSIATSVLLNAGAICSNDGSHYALVRALVDDGTPAIDPYVELTRHIDLSRRGEHYYSDRPPGTALLAVPFYAAAKALDADDATRQRAVVGVSILAAALASVLVMLIARHLGFSLAGAMLAGLALALATPMRSYGTVLFNHALCACLIALLAWLALLPATPRRRALLGLVAGLAVAVDYSAAIVGAIIIAATAFGDAGFGDAGLEAAGERPSPRGVARALVPAVVGGLVGIVPLLVYHTIAFGTPFTTTYAWHEIDPAVHGLGSMYAGSFLRGLFGLLVLPDSGLFLYSPILAVGLFGLPELVRRAGRVGSIILIAPWIVMIVVTAKHTNWPGGAHDARYLMLVVPLVAVPLAAVTDHALGRDGQGARPGWLTVLSGAFFLSAAVQAVKHHVAWARDGSAWLEDLAASVGGEPGPVLGAFARWAWPQPEGAAIVLALGAVLTIALWMRYASPRRDTAADVTRPPS